MYEISHKVAYLGLLGQKYVLGRIPAATLVKVEELLVHVEFRSQHNPKIEQHFTEKLILIPAYNITISSFFT